MVIDKDNFNAIIESCSTIGHDMSGQLHVLQFCNEEISENYPYDEHIQRSLRATNELMEQVKTLRLFLKKSLMSEDYKNLYDLCREAETLLKIHEPKDYSQLSFGQGLGDIVMVGFFLFTILVALTLLMLKKKSAIE